MGKKIYTNVITGKNKKENETLEEEYQRSSNFPINGGGHIPISDIRNFYLANDRTTLEAISEKYDIPLRDLRVVSNSEDWPKLREEIYRRTRSQVQSTMTAQLKDLLDVNLEIQQLKTIQLAQQVRNIQNHLAIFGDLWLRDPDNPGQILKDSNGLPKKIPIPQEMTNLQEMVKLTQGLNSLIDEREAGNETPLMTLTGDTKEPDLIDVFEVDDD